MTEKLICPICGEPTSVWYGNARKDRLCKKHAQELKEGIIEQCPDCEKWHTTKDICACKQPQQKELSDEKTLKCIICGKDSNGKHFCKECYYKYKDRAIDIRITHCCETEILDEYGNLIYTCDDGRKVRSRAEAIICSWLYNNKIRVKYEEVIYYKNAAGETKELKPDFYLPDYNLYIEYNEREDLEYKRKKEFAMKEYEKLKLKVVIMTGKDLQNVGAFIKPMLIVE